MYGLPFTSIYIDFQIKKAEIRADKDGRFNIESGWDEWIFNLFGDDDIWMMLFSDLYLDKDNGYHFEHWGERQFYC